ncbi:MAG: ABC-type transport auxiliary lipoprotein family protein [Zavarzinia sp.]|nr:ABC-type transport auxiliary lipoprotein family protein [Zavarzinia sp.]
MTDRSVSLSRRRVLNTAVLGGSAVMLGACGSLFKAATTTPRLFTLTSTADISPGPIVGWQLVVEEPLASRSIDTDFIALMPSSTEVKYFESARWAERAPRMVQTLLVESFENSRRIVAVGRQAVGLRADFQLISELREFQAEYRKGLKAPPVIRIRFSAKMILQPQQIIVAAQNFDFEEQLISNDIDSVIAGFDKVLDQTMRGVVEWALAQRNPNEGKLL